MVECLELRSPCTDCYKRSKAVGGPIRVKGYFCKDLLWDSRGLWSAGGGFEDAGAGKTGKCNSRFVVEEA